MYTFQTPHSQTQLRKEDSLFFVKGVVMVLLVTVGVSDDVAQELRRLAAQALKDVEEPMPSRPATLRDPGTLDQTVLDQLDAIPESALVQSARTIHGT